MDITWYNYQIPSRKLTYLWKIHYFDWVMFNSYISLPEGKFHWKYQSTADGVFLFFPPLPGPIDFVRNLTHITGKFIVYAHSLPWNNPIMMSHYASQCLCVPIIFFYRLYSMCSIWNQYLSMIINNVWKDTIVFLMLLVSPQFQSLPHCIHMMYPQYFQKWLWIIYPIAIFRIMCTQ